MEKFSKFIVRHKILIIGITSLLCIASIVAIMYVNVNSDILSYLPEGVDMTKGMNFMRENFDMQGDAIIGVADVNYNTMLNITNRLKEYEGPGKGIKDGGILWIGMIAEMYDSEATGGGLIDNVMQDALAKMLENEDVLNMFFPSRQPGEKFDDTAKARNANYLVMLQLNVPTSSDEAMGLLDTIDKIILKDYEHAIGGSTQLTKDIFDSTIGEIWKYLLVAVLVMFIVLLCSTTSLIEPFIFMLTLGISILINMGTNIFLKSVSVVTFAASSILQLGLSMDYAIFLMHAFAEEKTKTLDESLAMQRAIPKTFSTISSSALTTVFGFLALFFMQFKIGGDLGIVLAKGVFLSLMTVLIVQPTLMLAFSKASKKTEHRICVPSFKSVASFSVKNRKIVVILAVCLLIPCIIMQSLVGISYLKFTYDDEPATEIGKTVETMSNSVIVIVPVNAKQNYAFLDDLNELRKKEGNVITANMGMYSMLEPGIGKLLGNLIESGATLPDEASMIESFAQNGYTMYSIMLDCEGESEEASNALASIREILDKNFEGKEYYVTGMSQAVEDLKVITPIDFAIVSISSIIFILIILFIALKSFKLPFLLVAVIEFGIFINLALSYMLNQNINFMAYIIISSIQLGATVDYAILYTVKYQRYLEVLPAREACYRALRDSGVSIITSVAIMASCCLSVALVTSNRIVGEITMMIARGSIISGILTMVLLPAVLVLFTGNKKLKPIGKKASRKFKKEKKNNSTDESKDVVTIESTSEKAIDVNDLLSLDEAVDALEREKESNRN